MSSKNIGIMGINVLLYPEVIPGWRWEGELSADLPVMAKGHGLRAASPLRDSTAWEHHFKQTGKRRIIPWQS